jgi:hypothetical protein
MFAKYFGTKKDDDTHSTIEGAESKINEAIKTTKETKDEAKESAHAAWDTLKPSTLLSDAAHKVVDATQGTIYYTKEKLSDAKESISDTAKHVTNEVIHDWNVVKDASTDAAKAAVNKVYHIGHDTAEKASDLSQQASEKLQEASEFVQDKSHELAESKKWNLVNASAVDATEIITTGSSHKVDALNQEEPLVIKHYITQTVPPIKQVTPSTLLTPSVVHKYGDLNIHGAADHTPEIKAALEHIKHASDELKGLVKHRDK